MKPIICLGIILVFSILILGCTAKLQKADDTGVTPEAISSVVNANNQFAFDLYSALKAGDENLFFSPYSISTAFAMAYEGARGQTAQEIQSVLHFPEDNTARRAAFANIYNDLNKKDKEYKFSTANALWAQKDFAFLEEYMNTGQDFYGARITNLDFVGRTEESRKIINDWVEKQTNNKIKDLIPAGQIDAMTRLVITNAIYFKGEWVWQFDKKDTRDEDFKVSDAKSVKVPMMSLTGDKPSFNYYEDDELQVLEMPYKGEEISMLVLLPKEKDLTKLEESITAEKLNEWKNELTSQNVMVYMPKFTFDTKYFLSDVLKQMGMPTAFTDAADFSGMDGRKDLFIGFVIHQAFVDVNEEGTEAAAATAIGAGTDSVKIIQIFRADHPFIFIIQQKASGNILFIGRVMDPNA